MSAASAITGLASGTAFALTALPAIAAAAWFSPLVPAEGRLFGVLTFFFATLCVGFVCGGRYARGRRAAARAPWWLTLYATLATALVWGYGHAWLIDPAVSRLSILAPIVGLLRGARFSLALLLSASPLLMPAWFLVHRMLQRYGDRLAATAR